MEWQKIEGIPSAWMQLTSPDWKGFPCQTRTTATWNLFLLGEYSWKIPCNVDMGESELTHDVSRQRGSFLFFAWNRLKNEWHAWTDRFGTLHAYHASDGTRAALGTFSPAVAQAASQRRLDWEALAGWFSFGFFPADKTHYSDVHILRPASHYVFDQTGRLLKQERYWEWSYQPDKKRNHPDTVAEFGAVFHEALHEALCEGRVAVPISGGLDSRSTVAGIGSDVTRTGRAWSYSYGYGNDSVETQIARQVAEARRLPFQAYNIQPYLFDQMERVLAYTEGFQDITQARQMFVRDEIASHADVLIAALWGDVWLDEMGLADQPQATEEQASRHALKKIRKQAGWLLRQMILPQLKVKTVEPLLEEFVQAEMKLLAHLSSADFRVKAFKTDQWSFRWSIPPTRVFQSAAWTRKVFYDTRLADFFATVPASFLSGRRLQIDYLKRFAPDLARIPWQAYDANLYQYQYFNTWLLPKRAFKKIQRTLLGKKITERNWEVQFLNPAGRAGLERWLTRRGLKLHEFLPAPQLRELLDDFYRNPAPLHAHPLSMLLTFSAWLEIYA